MSEKFFYGFFPLKSFSTWNKKLKSCTCGLICYCYRGKSAVTNEHEAMKPKMFFKWGERGKLSLREGIWNVAYCEFYVIFEVENLPKFMDFPLTYRWWFRCFHLFCEILWMLFKKYVDRIKKTFAFKHFSSMLSRLLIFVAFLINTKKKAPKIVSFAIIIHHAMKSGLDRGTSPINNILVNVSRDKRKKGANI